MKPLKPDGRIDLKHRAERFRGRHDGSLLIAASAGRYVSVCDLGKRETQVHHPAGKVKAISPHPFESLFAVVEGRSGSLLILGFDGKQIAQVEPPLFNANRSRSLSTDSADCYFDESGEALWLAVPMGDDKCQLSLVETKGWTITQSVVVDDHFGQSYLSFHPTGKPGLVSLWIAAGQDGQEVYLLNRTGAGFSVVQLEEFTNCTPPAFSPDGTELLVWTENYSIRRFAFPSMEPLGSPCFSGDDDNPFVESLCYLDNRFAIAGTGEQRIFLLDASTMQIEDEIAIEGHEPRPIGEYYPRLAKETGLGTDITCFSKFGNVVVFVFRRDRGKSSLKWNDSLLWYSATRDGATQLL